MRRASLDGGLFAEEFVELTARPRSLLSAGLRLDTRIAHSPHGSSSRPVYLLAGEAANLEIAPTPIPGPGRRGDPSDDARDRAEATGERSTHERRDPRPLGHRT